MSVFSCLKDQFNPPKTDRERFEEEAWQQLRWRKSKEGKRQAEINKKIRKIEEKYSDDINPW